MHDGCILEDGKYVVWRGGYMDTIVSNGGRIVAWLHLELGCVRVTRMLHRDEVYPDIDTAIAATILKLS